MQRYVDAVKDDHVEYEERERSLELLRKCKRLSLAKERTRYNVINFSDKKHVWGKECATIDYPPESLSKVDEAKGKRRVEGRSKSSLAPEPAEPLKRRTISRVVQQK